MEVTEVSEKRFERAMDRLFSGSSTPAASSAGNPSPAKKKKEDQHNTNEHALQTAGIVVPLSVSHGCRPWDRGDLLRRLATFKSISWFGKPQVAGPVACARRGWVNVDIDLLACETCGSRLSFPVSPSWSRHQVERAALAFAEQLDTAHKGLCAWKNNPCAETLAHFPPTPLPVLTGAYIDRCEGLLQLSALPVISDAAKYQLKLSRGPQVDQLLSGPNPWGSRFLFGNGVSSSSSGNEVFAKNKAFYEAQRMIAICGWEPRLLHYTVDCEERSGAQSVNKQTGTCQGPGPSVTVHMQGGLQSKDARSQIKPGGADASDPASVVLDCNLCGASVGLWNFTSVNRPAPLLNSGLEEIFAPKKVSSESDTAGVGAAGFVDGLGLARGEAADALGVKAIEAVPVNVSEKAAPQKGVLDLKLTIAGGPPPTRLNAPIAVPPSFGIPGLLPKRTEAVTYAAASYESRRPEYQERGHKGRGTPEDNVESDVVDGRKMEYVEGSKDVKRKREDFIVESEQAQGGMFSRNAKRKREVGSQWPGFSMKQPARDLPHASSVNAIDTCYPQKQENSMESVDNLPPESDGQGANTVDCHEAEIQGAGANLERSESVAEFATDVTELVEELVSGRGLMDEFVPEEAEKADVKDDNGGSQQAMLGISYTVVKDSNSAGVSERCEGKRTGLGADEDANAGSTLDFTNAVIQDRDVDANLQVKGVTDVHMVGESPVQRNEEVQSHACFPLGLPSQDVKKLEIQTGEFDPIRQHRHFCPWVNGHVAAATSSTGSGNLCGWQIMLDALRPQHQQHQPGFTESEFAASKYKDDPLISVRKLLGSVSSNHLPRT